jgi:ParB family chromosome partitioning protein
MGHGRALINIEDNDVQGDIYHKIVTENLSVRDTEALVKKYQESLLPKAKKPKSDSFQIDEEQKKTFAHYFGAKVDIKSAGNGKGKITIPFYSEEDFERILKLIKE